MLSAAASSCQTPVWRSSASPSRCRVWSRPIRSVCSAGLGSACGGQGQHAILGAQQQRAVEAGQAFLADLVVQFAQPFEFALGTQLQGDQALRPGAHAVADIAAGHDEILALIVAAANDHVGVGMTGVEMIDGDPIELAVEIAFHLPHQIADEGLQVGEAGAVVGRDDEAELMRVGLRAVEKGQTVGVVAGGVIELAGLALARDAIALDVVEMGAGGAEIAAGDGGVARLDDDAPAAGSDQAGGGAHARPHAAPHGAGLDVAFRPRWPRDRWCPA